MMRKALAALLVALLVISLPVAAFAATKTDRKVLRDGTEVVTVTETWFATDGEHEKVTMTETKRDGTKTVTVTETVTSTSSSSSSSSSNSSRSSQSSSSSSSSQQSSSSSSSSSWAWWESAYSSGSTQQYESSWAVVTFPDVAVGSWYYNHAGHTRSKGLMSGFPDGTFRPGDTLSRAQVAQVVYRMMGGVNTSQYPVNNYRDVSSSDWYYVPIRAVVGAFGEDDVKYYKTTSNLTGEVLDSWAEYRPNEPASRVHFVKLLAFLINAKGLQYVGPAVSGSAPSFSDIGDLAAGTQEYIRAFAQVGLLNGMGDGKFQPYAALTRAQAAKVLDLFTDYYVPKA